jgi:hypothetical protein
MLASEGVRTHVPDGLSTHCCMARVQSYLCSLALSSSCLTSSQMAWRSAGNP